MSALDLKASSRTTWSSSEQAYVPAEQPSAGQGARLPRADAHPGRPRCPRRAPPQGPRPVGCLSWRRWGNPGQWSSITFPEAPSQISPGGRPPPVSQMRLHRKRSGEICGWLAVGFAGEGRATAANADEAPGGVQAHNALGTPGWRRDPVGACPLGFRCGTRGPRAEGRLCSQPCGWLGGGAQPGKATAPGTDARADCLPSRGLLARGACSSGSRWRKPGGSSRRS